MIQRDAATRTRAAPFLDAPAAARLFSPPQSFAEVAQTGRAPPCQGGCRGFKSRLPLHPRGAGGRRPLALRLPEGSLGPSADPAADPAAVERAIAALIAALGLDPAAEPELRETPARVAGLYREIFAGLGALAEPDLATFPREGGSDELVVVRDLPFHSLCIHHFVPFFGRATIAYVPGDRLIGISGPARVLEHYARRPQLQERIGQQVAAHLERRLAPRGVAVLLEARHLCMEMRGIRTRAWVETRAVQGVLADPRWNEALAFGPRPA